MLMVISGAALLLDLLCIDVVPVDGIAFICVLFDADVLSL
jgi:hypothetical protein